MVTQPHLCSNLIPGDHSMDRLLQVVLTSGACPVSAIAVHCHDTAGMALSNIDVALGSHGVTTLDSSIGGLGGCPYAGPGVPGNVATEAVVRHLTTQYPDRYSLPAQLQVDKLAEIGSWIREKLNQLDSAPS